MSLSYSAVAQHSLLEWFEHSTKHVTSLWHNKNISTLTVTQSSHLYDQELGQWCVTKSAGNCMEMNDQHILRNFSFCGLQKKHAGLERHEWFFLIFWESYTLNNRYCRTMYRNVNVMNMGINYRPHWSECTSIDRHPDHLEFMLQQTEDYY